MVGGIASADHASGGGGTGARGPLAKSHRLWTYNNNQRRMAERSSAGLWRGAALATPLIRGLVPYTYTQKILQNCFARAAAWNLAGASAPPAHISHAHAGRAPCRAPQQPFIPCAAPAAALQVGGQRVPCLCHFVDKTAGCAHRRLSAQQQRAQQQRKAATSSSDQKPVGMPARQAARTSQRSQHSRPPAAPAAGRPQLLTRA